MPVQISAVNSREGRRSARCEEVRVFLPSGEHTFRAEFVDDADARRPFPSSRDRTSIRTSFPSSSTSRARSGRRSPERSRKRSCRSAIRASGRLCVERILTALARRAYRRPVRPAEIAPLLRVFEQGEGLRLPARAESAVRDRGDAGLAAVPVPDRARSRCLASSPRVSDVELASRLSYFLWSSMPDEALLRLAESEPAAPARGADRAGEADDRRSRGPRRSPRTSPASGSRPAASTRSRRMRRSSPNGTPSCSDAMRTETRLFFEADAAREPSDL